MASNTEPTTAYVSLHIPTDVLADYVEQGKNLSKPADEVMEKRLRSCINYTGSKPLYFDDEDRSRLEALIGKNVFSPTEALQLLERQRTLTVENVDITLKPQLLARLKSRCFVPDFEAWLSKLVVEELERYCGLR